MSVIIKGAVRLYYYLNEEIADPRSQDWFTIRTPWLGLTVIGLYLMMVFKWLPAYMSKRPAYDLRGLIAAYNIFQIIGCAYVVYQSLVLGWLNHYKMICQPVDEGPYGVEYAWRVCYGYYALKVIDLMDTFFFVLRKKQNQVTFLHVYHHFGMVMVSWGIVKWVPGGHGTFLVTLNSFVHIIMYMYYLLTVWDENFKKSIWWKKYVTQIQIGFFCETVLYDGTEAFVSDRLAHSRFYYLLADPPAISFAWALVVFCNTVNYVGFHVQFSVLLLHFIMLAVTPECGFPKAPAYLLIPQNLFMVILFGDFYYRSYVKKPKKA